MSGVVGQLAVIFRAGIFMLSILATIETGLREFIEMLLENMLLRRVVSLGYQR
jgi:hypothetical protein